MTHATFKISLGNYEKDIVLYWNVPTIIGSFSLKKLWNCYMALKWTSHRDEHSIKEIIWHITPSYTQSHYVLNLITQKTTKSNAEATMVSLVYGLRTKWHPNGIVRYMTQWVRHQDGAIKIGDFGTHVVVNDTITNVPNLTTEQISNCT
jgi:hypothetical protein